MKTIDLIPAYETTLNYIFTQIFFILETDRRRRRSDSRGRSDRGRRDRDEGRKDDRKKKDDEKKKEPEAEKSADKTKKDPEPVKEAAKSLIAPDEPAPPGRGRRCGPPLRCDPGAHGTSCPRAWRS